jgi:CubicO group peptidase (beta-lactamase class C family)
VTRLPLVALLLVNASAINAQQVDLDSQRVVGAGIRVDSVLSTFEAEGFSGTVLVARKGVVLLLKGYGHADHELRIRNTPATHFEMNSLTKTFTAAAILQLQARSKLKASENLERLLGEWPAPKDRATIHHLATHTSGLIPEGAALTTDGGRDGYVRSVKNVAAESMPGEKYRYTNAGYSVLAAVIEAASGMSFEAYLRKHLFEPAGMRTAYFRDERPDSATPIAKGYAPVNGQRRQVDPGPYVWGTRGAGGIYATVGDMYRWFSSLRAGRIIDSDALKVMFHPWPNEGYGWHVEAGPYGQQIHKGGGSQSFANQIYYYPDHDILIIWASNDLTKRWRADLNRAIPAALH